MTENFYSITDIHSHFLFAVDDGAENQVRSLNMLFQAVELKITHLLATPHATDLTTEEIGNRFIEHFGMLQSLIEQEKLDIKISLASELYFSSKIYDWMKYPWATFNNNRKYLLFELPLFEMPQQVKDFIFQCRLEGITPILAHPERYSYMNKNISVLIDWRRQGCMMQVNAGSVTGQFGARAQKTAIKLIQAGMINFIASDAHEPDYRNYKQLIKAREILAVDFEDAYLNELFSVNPHKAIEGQPIESSGVDERLLEDNWLSYQGILNKINKVFRL